MTLLKQICKKVILIIITISILIMFCSTPASYAKLDLKDGEFYYAGTTKGTYTVKDGVFSWLLDNIGQIADWLLGIMTMGFRMVFVGWTALIEKLLTWGLETTAGVNSTGEEVDGMSSTNLTSITDSSGNVTVQAIVYNQVPAFNINFFDDEYDKSVSGTGMKYRCDKCDTGYADECCTEAGCSCECKGNCDGCKRYLEALAINEEDNPPIVVQIKNLVATWYYIMRFLSIAAMLIVLIGIGIKMAISTIASEKAVYKRMLVDWIIGVIILFAIHYFMLFIININEYLVETIKDSANHMNTVEMKQLSGTDAKIEKTNEDIEIDVYEETRTRAYDAKLSNGLTGMVMYMTLVYFAIRYSLVYIKRYLTLIVLTLMGPAVGVAYALQKVFSGKSSTMKTWMTEYIMNVIIQVVHAIIYGVFISTALVLSLESVAGTIVALILMNFSLKAEKIFRKIFKMGEGDSLLGHTADAGDADKIKQRMDAMAGLYIGAKPAAQALMNSPYAKALKGAGKIGLAAGGAVAAGVMKKNQTANKNVGKNKDENFERDVDRETDKNGEGSDSRGHANDGNPKTEGQYNSSGNGAKQAVIAGKGSPNPNDSIKKLMEKGEDALKSELINATSHLSEQHKSKVKDPNAEEKFNEALANYTRLKSYKATTADIVKGHGRRLVDIENNFTVNKSGMPVFNFNNLRKGIFGTTHKDLKTGKYVSDHNGYYENFKPSNLLGFTDADKKVFKEQILTPMRNGLGGMAAMFVGMGTIVAHPSLGMGLLAGGAAAAGKTFKKPTNDKKYKGSYGFSRFSTPALREIQKAAIARANREWDALVDNNMKENHVELYNALRADNTDLRARGGILPKVKSAVGFAPRKFIQHTGLSSNLDAINLHAAKQLKTQQLEFIEDYANIQASITMGTLEHKANQEEMNFIVEEFKKQGFEYDPEENTFKATDKENLADKTSTDPKEQFDAVLTELYKEQGLVYDPKTGLAFSKEGDKSTTDKKVSKELKAIIPDAKLKVSTKDLALIDKEIDKTILQSLQSGEELKINDMISEISSNLENKLDSKIELDNIFNQDNKKLISVLEKRASELKTKNPLLVLTDEQKTSIQSAVNELTEDKKDFSDLKPEDVLSKMKGADGSQAVKFTEGSKKADSTKDGSVELTGAVTKYIEALQNSKVVKPPQKEEIKVDKLDKAKASVKKKVEERRKKINQVLALEEISSIDEAISTEQAKKAEGDKDSSQILELLLMRKELEEINKFAAKELELKAGVAGYKQAVKDKSAKAVEYYKEKLEVQQFELENQQFYTKEGNPKSVQEIDRILHNMTESDEKVKAIENNNNRKEKLSTLENEMEKSERELKNKGPIINIEKTIKNIHTNNLSF